MMTYASPWFGPLYVAAIAAAVVALAFARRLDPRAALALSCFALAGAGLSAGLALRGASGDVSGTPFALQSITSIPRSAAGLPERLGPATAMDPELGIDVFTLHGVPGAPQPVALHGPDAQLEILGWAFDKAEHARCEAIAIVVEGRTFPAVYGFERTDVAALLGADHRDIGFRALIPAKSLPRGRHEAGVRCMGTAGRSYSNSTPYTFEVVP